MKAILVHNSESKKWNEFIMSSPQGTFGHLYGWENIYGVYGFESFPIAAIDDTGRIRGVLRLFLMKDILGKKYLISNPFLSYGGVCADDNSTKTILIHKAREIAVQNHVQYIEIRQLATRVVNDLPTKSDFVTMFLRLDRDEEIVWKNSLTSKVRNQVRKAIKSGLSVHSGKEYFDDFYRVLSVNFRDLGTPLHGKAFFRKILEEFDESSGILVAEYKDKVIAGMLYIHFKNVFNDPWASSLREYNNLCPNNILYWEAIKYACKNGFEYFDFGRSTIDQGTLMFKKQWGAEQIPLYYQYSLNRAKTIAETTAVNKNKYQLAIHMWKRLPLIMSNAIGPVVVRYLPEF
jgi:FemAB-related protein (PEP-CTERM system-associated)